MQNQPNVATGRCSCAGGGIGGPALRHRLRMLELAVADEATITVDDCELKREGKSFTFDTLSMYRAQLPDTPLYMLDTAKRLFIENG